MNKVNGNSPEELSEISLLQLIGVFWMGFRYSSIGLIIQDLFFPFKLMFSPVSMVLHFWETYFAQRLMVKIVGIEMPAFLTFVRLYVYQNRCMALKTMRSAWNMEGIYWDVYTDLTPKWHHQIGRLQTISGSAVGFLFLSLFNWNNDRVSFDNTTEAEIAEGEEKILQV